MKFFLYFVLILLGSCSPNSHDIVKKKDFDSNGRILKECSIRRGDGRGPYIKLGKTNKDYCKKLIKNHCQEKKFKQIHKNKGYFARGKFGDKIMIGTCL